MPHTNYQLSGEEMERFRKQGYLGPYALCSPDEMRGMQPAIERVLETDAPDHGVRISVLAQSERYRFPFHYTNQRI